MVKVINSIIDIWRKVERNLVSFQHEPQIEQKRDRHGNQYWQAYDFDTNKSYTFGSERDVRIWLENRYHNF